MRSFQRVILLKYLSRMKTGLLPVEYSAIINILSILFQTAFLWAGSARAQAQGELHIEKPAEE